jgi:hypothetical protein
MNWIKFIYAFIVMALIVCISILVVDKKVISTQEGNTSIIINKEFSLDDWICDSVNYIVDSTLQRHYIDDSVSNYTIVNNEIVNEEQLYYIIEPILNDTWGKEEMAIQKPFRINLIDNIWIITGSLPRLKDGGDVIGGVFYMEVKKDGVLLKLVHSE